MMDFALNHAYLIPLLPALAFAVILAFTRLNKKTSAFIAISAMSVSFLLAVAIAFGVVNEHIVMTTPFIRRALWVTIGGIPLSMGVLIDPLTAMMLFVVTTVSLLVEIYSIGYMEHDKGAGRFFAFLSLFSASMLGL
ncbi:MAG: NADH-quinone oxidoreductase subunit L, partial [Schwartzia sp.]|nr:NADH-quinone oxidoreductase subunit L [Schwartzia sp. (in: firmicutes)]